MQIVTRKADMAHKLGMSVQAFSRHYYKLPEPDYIYPDGTVAGWKQESVEEFMATMQEFLAKKQK